MTPARTAPSTATRLWHLVPLVVTISLGVGLLFGALFTEEFLSLDLVWLPAALVLVQAVALVWRSRRPELALSVATICDFAILFISAGELSVGTLAVMFAAYNLRMRRAASASRTWIGIAAAAAVLVTLLTASSGSFLQPPLLLPFAIVRALIAYGVPYFIAELVSGRARLLDALRERAELAERERERAAQQAVLDERGLMARELHDIAAHHLSGIIVSAQAAGTLVSREPERAKEYLRTLTREAQLTLANLRQTVGLLRVGTDGELAPLPAIAQIPELVEHWRSRGAQVTLHIPGEPIALGPLAEITAYRMVQESLTNAAAHAPGAACDVSVTYTAAALQIRVHNEAPVRAGGRILNRDGASGHGLLGMRERAQLIGGQLETGPDASGGWVNSLTIAADAIDALALPPTHKGSPS